MALDVIGRSSFDEQWVNRAVDCGKWEGVLNQWVDRLFPVTHCPLRVH